MRRHFSAWILMGAIVFVWNLALGDVMLSSAPLTGQTTGVSLLVEEPFVNPFGTKKPRIVSGFGKRGVALSTAPAVSEMHEGVDYAAPLGTAVRAARSGKVIFAGFSKMYASRADKTEQNRFVIIRHADGRSSRYVHLSVLHVRPGQDVQSGQVLGMLAESDEWKEPVLHFEIRDVQGQAVDPKVVVMETKQP